MNFDLTPMYMLDKVLEWFSMEPDEMGLGEQATPRVDVLEKDASRLIAAKFIELNSSEFLLWKNLIYQKLIKDKYLFDEGGTKYSITFDGKIFCKQGGYANAAEMERQKMKSQNRKDWLMILGTWLAGLGAFFLVGWEIYKKFFLECR